MVYSELNSLTALHLLGESNGLADPLSRKATSSHEWELKNHLLDWLFQEWGFPQIDLLASDQKSKCPIFCSQPGQYPRSLADTFFICWSHGSMYAFPPFPLIPRVLQNVKWEKTRIILVDLAWPHQSWFLDKLFSQITNLSHSQFRRTWYHSLVLHPNPASLCLTVWMISGCPK